MPYKNKTDKEYQREYYIKNRDAKIENQIEYFSEYYKENKEKIRQRNLERYYYKRYNIKPEKIKHDYIVSSNFIISILND